MEADVTRRPPPGSAFNGGHIDSILWDKVSGRSGHGCEGSRTVGLTMEAGSNIELVAPGELGESLSALRLCVSEAQRELQLSLSKLGQLTPLQAYRVGGRLELFDGLKRLRAARDLSWPNLRVEVHGVDSAGAKVRMLRCNASSALSEIEEAWVVRSLYRDDQISQPGIAMLLNRHKSWVCRRLALAEDLSDELTANLRLGLLSTTAAAELARLQRCNQDAAAKVAIRRGLTTRQTARLVESLLAAPEEQWPTLLEQASHPALPEQHEAKATMRTPGEQLVSDAWAMKRLAARLHARLLERSLTSLGDPVCSVTSRELAELRDVLVALTRTLDLRLASQGTRDVAA
jgi:ParB-like chromosome segregation protein Spo0J